MFGNSTHTEELFDEPRSSLGPKLIAAAAALAVTAGVFFGYLYIRKRHTQQELSRASQTEQLSNVPKGPPKAHILVDDAMLKGGQTIIGGSVKNISNEKLDHLSIQLELRRRKDGTAEQRSVPLDTVELEPGQEGRYSLVLQAQDYSSVKLTGLMAGEKSSLIAYSSSPGQKRPPERFDSKTIVIQKPSPGRGGFLNSPERPTRIP
jgi:hypothetical protein